MIAKCKFPHYLLCSSPKYKKESIDDVGLPTAVRTHNRTETLQIERARIHRCCVSIYPQEQQYVFGSTLSKGPTCCWPA